MRRRPLAWIAAGMLIVAVSAALGVAMYLRASGLRVDGTPGRLEGALAGIARRWAVPPAARRRPNPVPDSAEARADGMVHFADHCAVCHGNDGSGTGDGTMMGRGFYPAAPDMRDDATQAKTDGELFWIIEHGIRFTGMPGWSTGTPAGEASSWRLVRFIRHLPRLTPQELEAMRGRNPRPPDEIRFELEEERFLSEGAAK